MYRFLVLIALFVLFISPGIKQEIKNFDLTKSLNQAQMQIKKIEENPQIKGAIDSIFEKVQHLVDQYQATK